MVPLLAACLPAFSPAGAPGDPPCVLGSRMEQGPWVLQLGPTLDLGLPVNRGGARARAVGTWSTGAARAHAGLDLAAHVVARDLGVPGVSLGAALSAPVGIELHGVGLAWEPIGYLDSRGTSHVSGAVTVSARRGGAAWHFRHENDYVMVFGHDGLRTAAVDTHLFVHTGRFVWGIGAEMKLWTASTEGIDKLDHGQVYDLRGQRGEGFSHGILCLAVTVGPARACVGWDAEGIRDTIQNDWVHRLVNDGIIAPLDREPRHYVRVTLNPPRTSY